MSETVDNLLIIFIIIIHTISTSYLIWGILNQITTIKRKKSLFYICASLAVIEFFIPTTLDLILPFIHFLFLYKIEKKEKIYAFYYSTYAVFFACSLDLMLKKIILPIFDTLEIKYNLEMITGYLIELSFPSLHKFFYQKSSIASINLSLLPSLAEEKILKPAGRIFTVGIIIVWATYSFKDFFDSGHPLNPFTYTNFTSLLVVFTFVFILFFLESRAELYNRKIQEVRNKQQIKDMDMYINGIEQANRNVRRYRHDMGNIFLTLRTAIKNRDIDEVEEIYKSVIKDAEDGLARSQGSAQNLDNIENKALKSIVSNKIFTAQEKGIDIVCSTIEAINEIFIDDIDYIRIVSILMDNAIEAAVTAENPTIVMHIIYKKGNLELGIKNNFKEGYIAANTARELFEEGTTSNKEGRGIGLSNVRLIAEKYGPGRIKIETKIGKNEFSQTVTTFPKTESEANLR